MKPGEELPYVTQRVGTVTQYSVKEVSLGDSVISYELFAFATMTASNKYSQFVLRSMQCGGRT